MRFPEILRLITTVLAGGLLALALVRLTGRLSRRDPRPDARPDPRRDVAQALFAVGILLGAAARWLTTEPVWLETGLEIGSFLAFLAALGALLGVGTRRRAPTDPPRRTER